LIDPAAVLSVMEVVAEDFQAARRTTSRRLAEVTSLPEPLVADILDRLVAAQLLHRLAGEETAVALTQPPDQVTADRLIQIGFDMADRTGARRPSALADRLRQVQTDVAARITLASLASPPTAPDG
jgi:DNA-binding IscR family transcriptional regulator